MNQDDNDTLAKIRERLNNAFSEQEDAPANIIGDDWSGHLSGTCPVQGFGTVQEREWYFRARHETWRFEIYKIDSDPPGLPHDTDVIWTASDEYNGSGANAGWMRYSEAWTIIENCIKSAKEQNFVMFGV